MNRLLFAIVFIVSTNSYAQWQQTGGPVGGSFTCLARQDSLLFAGSSLDGILISHDSGATWITANTGISCFTITSLAVIGNSIFASTDSCGIFVSTTGGINWTPSNNGLSTTNIQSLFTKSSSLYAATKSGLFVSINNGSNWNQLYTQWTDEVFSSGSHIIIGCGGKGVFHSDDNGLSWNSVNSSLDSALVGFPGNQQWWHPSVKNFSMLGNKLFACTNMGMYYSTDTGYTWSKIIPGITTNHTPHYITTIGGLLFIGSSSGIHEVGLFESSDTGTTWKSISNGIYAGYAGGISSVISIDSSLVSATGNNIFRSTNNGIQWSLSKTDIRRVHIRDLKSDNNRLVAATSGGVFSSLDSGNTWQDLNIGLPTNGARSIASAANMMYVGTSGSGQPIYCSSDSGKNWTQAKNGLPYDSFDAITIKGTEVYAGTFYGVFHSLDSGKNWSAHNNGFPFSNVYVQSLTTNGNFLYAGTQHGVYSSYLNGTWNDLNIGLPFNPEVWDIAVMGNNLFAATMDDGIFSFINSSGQWNASSAGLSVQDVTCLNSRGTEIFAGTFGGGIFASRDSGKYWFPVNIGLNDMEIMSLARIGDYLFAGTNKNSVFKAHIDSLLLQVGLNEETGDMIMISMYPNPTSGFLSVSHPVNSTDISITDVLGQQVYITKTPSGNQSGIDLDSLTPGIYFLQVKTADGIATKKIIKE